MVTINGTVYRIAPKITVGMLMDIERNHLAPGERSITSLLHGDHDSREVTAIFASELTGLPVSHFLALSVGEFAAISTEIVPIIQQSFADPLVTRDDTPGPSPDGGAAEKN